MSTYRAVLERLNRGQSIEQISAELDRREDALRGMIQSMLQEGHLRELGCEGDSCDVCPMSASCPMADLQGPASYMVTEAGTEFILDGQVAGD